MSPATLLTHSNPLRRDNLGALADDRLHEALREWDALGAIPKGMLIGGVWSDSSDGRSIAVENPATDQVLCAVADANGRDALAALDAATDARGRWAATPSRERSHILRRAASLLVDEIDRLALVLTLEMGKPVSESRDEVMFAAEYLDWYADEARRIDGTCSETPDGRTTIMVRRQPIGPTLVITPWNFPLAVPARSVAPAIAAGCTVVLRPSKLTPLSALALADVLMRAGLPAGVLNVVVSSADDATDGLLSDPRLRKLTFTGSTTVGRHLMGLAGPRMLRTSMELGGLAPFVVFADADLDAAVEGAIAAKLRNGGAACTAANRIYVERPVARMFATRLAERFADLRVGPGTEAGVDVGPMISAAHVTRLAGLVADAVACGATVLSSVGGVPDAGHFVAPCVIAEVPDHARVMREEIFGPIAPIAAFDTEQDVLARCNSAELGLAAYLYTSDLDRALRVGEALDAGMVAINQGRVSNVAAPFGGVKQSGFGRSGGAEGIDEFVETSYLAIGRARSAG